MMLGGGQPSPNVAHGSPAILVPLTGPRADVGQLLVQAAKLALPEQGGPQLDVLDTGGTPDGAAAAAQNAIAHGDGLILGPLTSAETAAVAPVAQQGGIPVLAFTNDASKAQPGVWVLGITPDQQVRRLIAAMQSHNKSHVAALLPDTDFGHAMANALTSAAGSAGLPPPNIQMHGQGMPAITAAARAVSDYADRRGPIEAKIKAARERGTPEGRREAQDLARTPIPPPPFDTLLLADTGDALQEVAAILPYYDVDRSAVQIIGPALWADPATGSGSVSGAWYAAPDSSLRAGFVQGYSARYGVTPQPIADLAYDAASVARLVTSGGGAGVLTQPTGFVGSDGWFTLTPDGQVRRGLAVYRVGHGASEMIEPAPQAAGGPGS